MFEYSRHFTLFVIELADDFVAQQVRTLAQSSQRRFQLMRYMLEKTCLLVLERDQSLAQPVELFAKHFDIVRTADVNALRELAFAKTVNRGIQIADRSR